MFVTRLFVYSYTSITQAQQTFSNLFGKLYPYIGQNWARGNTFLLSPETVSYSAWKASVLLYRL